MCGPIFYKPSKTQTRKQRSQASLMQHQTQLLQHSRRVPILGHPQEIIGFTLRDCSNIKKVVGVQCNDIWRSFGCLWQTVEDFNQLRC